MIKFGAVYFFFPEGKMSQHRLSIKVFQRLPLDITMPLIVCHKKTGHNVAVTDAMPT